MSSFSLPVGSVTPGTAASRVRVLIADDDADVCALVSRVLRPLADVTAVHDAETALAMLEFGALDLRYDAIIADYMLPGMTGLEFISKVRALAIDSPVLMISGHERLEPRLGELALAAGADAFLGKPFSLGQLRATVQRLLSTETRSVA